MPASLTWLRMTPRPRGCLLATTLLSLPYRSCAYLPWPPPECLLAGLRPSSPLFRAAVRLQRASRDTASGRRFSSIALLAERRKMVGPSPRPVEVKPMVDADGNELSKPTKRKAAIVVGYVGTAFHGWQESTDRSIRTVEGVLETALWKAGAIADSNYGDLNKIGWGRTSRTDKGVHASKTVASAKLLLPQETFNEAGLSQFGKDILNKQLPPDVRCFSVSKVPKSFRGREECTLREYSYYLPKHLLPDEATVVKFRRLLNTFVGSHSFHNFASMRGRQLKEIRKRVQASIELKKAAAAGSAGGGNVGEEGASRDDLGGGSTAVSEAADGDSEHVVSHDDGRKAKPMSKRERSKDWRTYRYKKKEAVQQDEEDAWYGKPKPTRSEPSSSCADGGGAEKDAAEIEGEEGSTGRDADDTARRNAAKPVPVGLDPVDEESAPNDAHVGDDGDGTEKDAVESKPIRGSAGAALAIGEDDQVDGEDEEGENEDHGNGAGEEGPQRVLMLRELRTSHCTSARMRSFLLSPPGRSRRPARFAKQLPISISRRSSQGQSKEPYVACVEFEQRSAGDPIYRCEVLDGVARHTREGQTEADEFLRIDISGKAFVYNQIRLMIGGALGEARGELMPGFVDAALKTPYKLRVPLAPADGLVLESQAFTRHANALVLDPRDLSNVGGTLVKWGHMEGGNQMQTSGRLQTLMTLEQREEAEKWRDEHILSAVAEAWAQRGSAELFLEAVQKFFVGQQQGKELQAAVKEHLEKLAETERAAEEKHNRHRLEAKMQGSTKYKDLLPKNIATRIICKFRLLPGNKVSAIQRGVAKKMEEGELPLLADCEQVLKFVEEKGVEEMAKEGGFVPPEMP